MWNLISLIPMLAGLFGGGGNNNGGSDPSLARLSPILENMFRTQSTRMQSAQPLYDAVLRQAFRGLPTWARAGVPGAGSELNGRPPLIAPVN